jgi:nicotinamide-nucleotide amidase
MIDREVHEAAKRAFESCKARSLTLTTAESCTGGLVAAALTDIAGASDVFDRGFVTYSNDAKRKLLGVPKDLLERHGAVSAEVAAAMADGARREAGADAAIAITGIAGPGGGSAAKPVGLVYIACIAGDLKPVVREFRFGDPGRDQVRRRSVLAALALLDACVTARGR